MIISRKKLKRIILQEILDVLSQRTGPNQEDEYESTTLPNAQYNRDWVDNITTYDYGMNLAGDVETPGFALRLPDGTLTQDPVYFPTEGQISQDSRFCLAHNSPVYRALGSKERGGMYRGSTKINGAYLHLDFDYNGFMVLKPIGRTQPGIDHHGGSHWDKHHTLNLSKSRGGKCNYDTPRKVAGQHGGEFKRGRKLNRDYLASHRKKWSDKEWRYYSFLFILKELEDLRNYSIIVKYALSKDKSIHPDALRYIERPALRYQGMSRLRHGATDSEREGAHSEIIANLKREVESAREQAKMRIMAADTDEDFK